MADKNSRPADNDQQALAPFDPVTAFGITTAEDRDPFAVQVDIVNRLLAATTLEELFAVHEGDNSQRLVGHTLRLSAVAWDTFDSDNGPIPMAKITATDVDTDTVEDFRSTSLNITAFTRVCEREKLFPVVVKVEGVKTRQGQTALKFSRP